MEKKSIVYGNRVFGYKIRRSRRAKRTILTIKHNGEIMVTLTMRAQERTADIFVKKNIEWIATHHNNVTQNSRIPLSVSKNNLTTAIEDATKLITGRIIRFNQLYGFSFNRISIKDSKNQWGSCSPKKNISFNVRLLYLPPQLSDLVVVHELCHLQEMNHSRAFWSLVAKTIPHYERCEKELKNYSIV